MAGVPVPQRVLTRRGAVRAVFLAALITVGLTANSVMRPAPAAAFCSQNATCGTIDYVLFGPGQGGVHSNDYAGCDTLDGLPHSCSEKAPVGDSLTITMAVEGPTCGSGWTFTLLCGTVGSEATTSAVLVVPSGTTTITVSFGYVDQIVVYATKPGTGTGTVTSYGAGYGYPNLDCGSRCAANLPGGIQIVFWATPAAGSAFDHWATGCTGDSNPKCALTPTDGMTLSAVFDRLATPAPKPTSASTPKPTPAPISTGAPSMSSEASATAPAGTTSPASPQATIVSTSAPTATASPVETGASPGSAGAPGSGSASTGGGSALPLVVLLLVLLLVALGGGALLRRRGGASRK